MEAQKCVNRLAEKRGLSAFEESKNRAILSRYVGSLAKAQLLDPQDQGLGVDLRVAEAFAHASECGHGLNSRQNDAIGHEVVGIASISWGVKLTSGKSFKF